LHSDIAAEFQFSDANVQVTMEPLSVESTRINKVFARDFKNKIIYTVNGLLHGVVSYTPVERQTETSNNVAIVQTIENGSNSGDADTVTVIITLLARSAIDSDRDALVASLASTVKLADPYADIELGASYPAWKRKHDSQLLNTALEVYKTTIEQATNKPW